MKLIKMLINNNSLLLFVMALILTGLNLYHNYSPPYLMVFSLLMSLWAFCSGFAKAIIRDLEGQ